ncbi:MAG: phosphatase PAP2 family protein [Bacteroidota bacterium]
MKKLILFLVLISLTAVNEIHACSGSDSSLSTCQFIKRDSVISFCSQKGYVPSILHNFGAQFVSPVHMKVRDIFWALGVASVTALLFHYDYSIDERIRYSKDKSNFIRVTSPVVTEFGNTYGIGLVGACGLIGAVTKDRKLFQTSLLASQAAITSGIWVRLIKYCTSRERPSASYTFRADKGHQGGYWYGFFKQYDKSVTGIGRDISFFDAFPSGHTSTAFAIASVFAMQYSDRPAIPIIAYSLAGLVGVSRMIEHTHWASDVFVGAWAGYLCAKQVVHHHSKIFSVEQLTSNRKRKAEVFLTAADQFAGFKLRMVF